MRAGIQGRKLFGQSTVEVKDNGIFIYRRLVYNIVDFPEGKVNLDTTKVKPIAEVTSSSRRRRRENKKKRKNKKKVSYAAVLLSNIEDCPDAKSLL